VSPREQTERVQAALRAQRAEADYEPLRSTVSRVESALRTRGRWLLLATLLGGGGLTAKETGALDLLIPKAPADARVNVLEKRTANTERLVRWLVRQEIRRQAREGGTVSEPPEDVE
jgi:hypothetical protein